MSEIDLTNPADRAPLEMKPFVDGLDLRIQEDRLEFWKRFTGCRNRFTIRQVLVTKTTMHWILREHFLCVTNRFRPLSSVYVQGYALEYNNGSWVSDGGTPMSFSYDGRYCNGFTRGGALLLCSAPAQEFPFQGPLTAKQIEVLDRGKSRTLVDKLSMKYDLGSKQQPHLFIRMLLVIRHHLRQGIVPFRPDKDGIELDCLAKRFLPDYWVLFSLVAKKREYKRFRTDATLAAFCYAHHVDSDSVLPFWKKVIQNDRLRRGSALHTIHNAIVQSNAKKAVDHLYLMRRLLHGLRAATYHRDLKALETAPISEFEDPNWNITYERTIKFSGE
jgi:hypothetical protein